MVIAFTRTYENSSGGWYDGGVPIPFLEVYRDEEYSRTHTKGMSTDEARKFAQNYYGWDDEPSSDSSEPILDDEFLKDPYAAFSFRYHF